MIRRDIIFFKKKYYGAIGFFKLEKFWNNLSEDEKKLIYKACSGGISIGISSKNKKKELLEDKKFSIPFKFVGNKEIPLSTPIDYFEGCLGNLLYHENGAYLFIKWYEYLLKNYPKVNILFSLYFFHMNAMKAYKKVGDLEKAVKAAKKNIELSKKLCKEINREKYRNPCYEFLLYYYTKKESSSSEIKKLKKIGKKCGWE